MPFETVLGLRRGARILQRLNVNRLLAEVAQRITIEVDSAFYAPSNALFDKARRSICKEG